jgi:microcystin-dependent protein
MPSPTIGEVRMFAFGRAPTGWLVCDGSTVKIDDHSELFMLLGARFGGDGGETFGLPDLRGRVPLHQGQGVGLTNRNLADKGGSETAILQTQHMPTHTHAFMVSTDLADQTDPTDKMLAAPDNDDKMYAAPDTVAILTPAATADATTTIAGASEAHDNTMPTLTVSYCIAAKGSFPSRP